MAAEMVVRASGMGGEGALYVTIACGAVGLVAGAAIIWYTRERWCSPRGIFNYLVSRAAPKAHREDSQRAHGQMTEWMATQRRSNREHRRLARSN